MVARFLFYGSIAQSVEQRTENPRVAGSIPARATKSLVNYSLSFFYTIKLLFNCIFINTIVKVIIKIDF